MDPTPEQQTILEGVAGSDTNLQINAYAGCGKTSTLGLIERSVKGPTLCLAFNKAVKEEMEERFGANTTVKTLNGLGHSVWAATCSSRPILNTDKCKAILREKVKALGKEDRDAAWEGFYEILAAVGLAKSLGYIPEGKFPAAKRLINRDELVARLEEKPTDLQLALLDATLHQSILSAYQGNIDFNDQIYMPGLFGGSFPKFPLVLVDEAQDLSPTNHEMLLRMRTSRIVSVGDPFQSIYQFRGACQDGMGRLASQFRMTELPLSVSWRCPSEVVKNARWRVPKFRWSREGGRVERLGHLNFDDIPPGSAIICRNNAPLFSLAFSAISNGRSVSVAGSDLSAKLVGVMRRFGDSSLPRPSVLSAIDEWYFKRQEAGSKTAGDAAECMRIFANKGKDLGQAIAYAEDIFKQKGSVRLTTGHKAKGLEWPHVYHLDPWLLGDDEQELNLRYVIQTRAAEGYYEIESRNIEW